MHGMKDKRDEICEMVECRQLDSIAIANNREAAGGTAFFTMVSFSFLIDVHSWSW